MSVEAEACLHLGLFLRCHARDALDDGLNLRKERRFICVRWEADRGVLGRDGSGGRLQTVEWRLRSWGGVAKRLLGVQVEARLDLHSCGDLRRLSPSVKRGLC